MKNLTYLFLLIFICQCRPKVTEDTTSEFDGKPEVPSSIKLTHKTLLEQLHNITLYEDKSTETAVKLEELMQHHFSEEEDFILPLLGLLPMLTKDEVPPHNKEIIALSEKVQSHLDHMSAEHQLITAYIKELKAVTSAENLQQILDFENEILKHAKSEEEVFFPASILVGNYLKLKLAEKQQ